ncbi:MAG: excisionase family DNA-binding protein [Rubripirellula sp.]
MPELLTCSQAARRIGVSNTTLKRMCDERLLTSVRTAGGHRRIGSDEVERWVKQNRLDSAITLEIGLTNVSPSEIAKDMLNSDHMPLLGRIDKSLQEGVSLADLFDNYLAPAMWVVGQQWRDKLIDVYQEHLCTINMQELLLKLRSNICQQSSASDNRERNRLVAIGCASGSDQHSVASLMIDIALQSVGWNAQTLGGTIPTQSLIAAAREKESTLIWVCYTEVSDLDQVVKDNRELHEALGPNQYLAIGGQALTPSVRRRLKFDFAGDSIEHLLQFAQRIRGNLDLNRTA